MKKREPLFVSGQHAPSRIPDLLAPHQLARSKVKEHTFLSAALSARSQELGMGGRDVEGRIDLAGGTE